jgi:peptidoglycan hydrolase-like protein with peptidoglycan-binding domain
MEREMRSFRFFKEPQLRKVEKGQLLLNKGTHGPGVAQLQLVLNYLGNDMPRSFRLRKPDGIFGSETEGVVKRFQQQNGLKADGIVGPHTLAKMDALLVAQPYLDSASPTEYGARIRANCARRPSLRPVFYT